MIARGGGAVFVCAARKMSDSNPDNPGNPGNNPENAENSENFENDSVSDSPGALAWNEFDWEQYLREQDDAVFRYLGFYETFASDPERLTRISECMGWILPEEAEENAGAGADANDDASDADSDADDGDDDDTDDDDYFHGFDEPYTIQKNCVFVATRAIHLNLARAWERIADNAARVPQALALAYQASLHRGENNALLAIYALDCGDCAMAVSLFKRALGDLNRSLKLLDEKAAGHSPALAQYRERALAQIFDLREIWLEMIHECRHALERARATGPGDEDADE